MGMQNKTRLKRLEQLEYMLLNHKKLFKNTKFNIHVWVDDTAINRVDEETPEERCGTAACALGSACFYKPFRDAGLTTTDVHYYDIEPRYKNKLGMEAGAAFFGITDEETDGLFGGWNYYNAGYSYHKPVTAKAVAKRVRELITKYTKE